ncbi:nuclear transport factor 2 family protein [Tsuneonella mangrovi]|uniref:nuclear transport factor 2 family protein n=1 Tax=Tsuneonella mangrovi TaxID=1982042 RepID=UPI000BA20224|nr:nuclear transport factor 2 family protein [Tsuneonella mangrovi]
MYHPIPTALIGALLLAAIPGASQAQAEPSGPSAQATDRTQAVVAEITALEGQWSDAFVNKDIDFIERIVAPDFMLAIFEGRPIIVPRKYWMMNTRKWDIQAFSAKVLDVAVAGDTAVATVEGSWQVADEGKLIRDDSFFLTDTWVKKGDSWQVIRRHSQTTEDRMERD